MCKSRINNIRVSKSSYLGLFQFFNTIFREWAPYLHLQEVISSSLGKDHQNQQFPKVQSFNTTLKRSVPRNIIFIRCLLAHSAALSSNHGPGHSVRALCAGVCAPISSGDHVKQTLEKIQKNYEFNKAYRKISSLQNNWCC